MKQNKAEKVGRQGYLSKKDMILHGWRLGGLSHEYRNM